MVRGGHCPTCHAEWTEDTPSGLCPACLIRLALLADEGTDVDPGPAGGLAAGPGPWNREEDAAPAGAVIVPQSAVTRGLATLPAGAANAATPADARPEVAALAPRFEFLGEIARGGMGVVFRGRDLGMGREVAIKLLHEAHAGLPEMRRRFLEEAQIAGQLQHPGIVPIYEIGQVAGGRPFLVMKLIRGRTLVEILAEPGDRAGESRHRLALLLQVCQAMAYAHSRRVIHRDLKPANIMVGRFGQIRVMDWGLAKVLPSRPGDREAEEGEAPIPAPPPRDDPRLGTPAYMAPEQAAGDETKVDERTDVFSLGAILYEILAGAPPFQHDEPEEIFRKLQDAPAPSPRAARPGISRDLETICLKCLDRDPGRRYADAGGLARDLERFLEGRPITARPVGMLGRLDRWCRRNRVLALALAVAGLALLLLGAGGLHSASIQARLRTEAEAEAGRARMSATVARGQRDLARGQFEATMIALEELTRTSREIDPDHPDPEQVRSLRKHLHGLQIKLLDTYLERHDHTQESKTQLLTCMFNLGRFQAEFGPQDQSTRWYTRAMELGREFAEDDQLPPGEALVIAQIILNSALGLGANLATTGRMDSAIELWQAACEDARRFQARFPSNHALWEAHYAILGNLAQALKLSGHLEEAEEIRLRRERLLEAAPKRPGPPGPIHQIRAIP